MQAPDVIASILLTGRVPHVLKAIRIELRLDVFSGEHYHSQSVRDLEVPGKWFFAPSASLITSEGRLLLGMTEKLVTDLGGTWMACDTDSVMVVSAPKSGKVRPEHSLTEI